MERADDPARDRFGQPERTPDRDHGVADTQRVGVAQHEWPQRRARRRDVHDGEVGRLVGADERRRVGLPFQRVP